MELYTFKRECVRRFSIVVNVVLHRHRDSIDLLVLTHIGFDQHVPAQEHVLRAVLLLDDQVSRLVEVEV